MKRLRIAGALALALGLLLTLGVMSVAADGGATNTTPGSAVYFDNQPHSIDGNSSLWFTFYYALTENGKPRRTTITIPYGAASNVSFALWTPDNVAFMSAKEPFGRGQPAAVLCSTGWCQGDDLVWDGSLGATGIYYLQVTNNNSGPTTAQLTITGDGVSTTPPATPAPEPTPATPNMDDPGRAVAIDGTPQTIPGNSARWFSFFYLTNYNKPPYVTIRLQYGAKSGLQFEVYAPERLGQWWSSPPNGHGTVDMAPCATGNCATDDLTWGGAFGATGTYYVRVINPTPNDISSVLTLQWR
ncbi:MAG: hypothetical protein M1482_04695 [Chloroflexi bacterium]|nr:hypothetical protein [Chloroflexota bacterium]